MDGAMVSFKQDKVEEDSPAKTPCKSSRAGKYVVLFQRTSDRGSATRDCHSTDSDRPLETIKDRQQLLHRSKTFCPFPATSFLRHTEHAVFGKEIETAALQHEDVQELRKDMETVAAEHTKTSNLTRTQKTYRPPVGQVPAIRGMDDTYMWVRGSAYLNRLSGSSAFGMEVFRHCGGRIAFEELMRALFPTTSKAELNHLILMAGPEQRRADNIIDKETLAQVHDIFRIYDTNGDESLDEDEFLSAMEAAGYGSTECKEIFDRIDRDQSRSISVDEFLEWYVNVDESETPPDCAEVDASASEGCSDVEGEWREFLRMVDHNATVRFG
ncbi:hypothetical protein BSKO_01749 [Bryopsis sp. KO-2023]|nr:hypothetical protein BSKO_01749 [Bryopsis sp. KO-2023]